MSKLDSTRLREILHYDPETGIFTWKVKPSKRFPAGMQAGSLIRGYVKIHHAGHMYFAHRLAWQYVYGYVPPELIDHINGNPADNRICNLRLASTKENSQNRTKASSNSTHGFLGISYMPSKKLWRARIQVNGKRIYIGKYKSQEKAYQAYLEAKKIHHPFCNQESFA